MMFPRMPRSVRWVLMLLLAAASVSSFIEPARAAPFPESIVQVGPWRLGAYTRGQSTAFDGCGLFRVQNEGFGLSLGYSPNGVWAMSVTAPNWGLTVNQTYTTSLTIGASPFTFAGRAVNASVISIAASPEFFTALGTGAQLIATANQRHFTMSLDGLETAIGRLKDCAKQYAGRTLAPAQGAPPAAGAPSPAASGGTYSGTGFYIDANTIITNFHVINGCTSLRLMKNGASLGGGRVVAYSAGDDLAALRSDRPSNAFLRVRTGAPIRPAESVLVFGYPLTGVVSSTGNTTLGNVTALAGMRDDSRFIQISASVQPGNSGGPAVDAAGRLMGVVVAKLNAMAIARATGDIPQNVNFAIKAATLASFLEAHNIAYQSDASSAEIPNPERAERAEAASLQLVCRR